MSISPFNTELAIASAAPRVDVSADKLTCSLYVCRSCLPILPPRAFVRCKSLVKSTNLEIVSRAYCHSNCPHKPGQSYMQGKPMHTQTNTQTQVHAQQYASRANPQVKITPWRQRFLNSKSSDVWGHTLWGATLSAYDFWISGCNHCAGGLHCGG